MPHFRYVPLISYSFKVTVMPSAHGQIFGHKQLLDKNRSEGPIFIGLSQCTQTDSLIADRKSDLPYEFVGVSFGAHGPISYQSYCSGDNGR